MRLYGLFDSRYIPRPHPGGEFGDVALGVTINGHPDRTLVILLKKGNPKGRSITLRHSIGKDIYTQIQEFLHDPRIHMIGIGVPQRFEDGFVAELQRLATSNNKKLTLFGVNELSKIIQHIRDTQDVDLEDL